MNLAVPANNRVKVKESKNRYKYLDLARELKKTVVHESNGDSNCNWCSWYSQQSICSGTGNNKTCGDYPDYSIIKIGQNTKQNPRDLRKLAVTQSLVGKTRKGVNYSDNNSKNYNKSGYKQ